MKFWIDAQLSPKLADWLNRNYAVEARRVAALGSQRASDQEIFEAARDARSVIITRDRDFAELLEHLGPPPQVIWVTCGNTPSIRMQAVLAGTLSDAMRLLLRGESLVEITGRGTSTSTSRLIVRRGGPFAGAASRNIHKRWALRSRANPGSVLANATPRPFRVPLPKHGQVFLGQAGGSFSSHRSDRKGSGSREYRSSWAGCSSLIQRKDRQNQHPGTTPSGRSPGPRA